MGPGGCAPCEHCGGSPPPCRLGGTNRSTHNPTDHRQCCATRIRHGTGPLTTPFGSLNGHRSVPGVTAARALWPPCAELPAVIGNSACCMIFRSWWCKARGRGAGPRSSKSGPPDATVVSQLTGRPARKPQLQGPHCQQPSPRGLLCALRQSLTAALPAHLVERQSSSGPQPACRPPHCTEGRHRPAGSAQPQVWPGRVGRGNTSVGGPVLRMRVLRTPGSGHAPWGRECASGGMADGMPRAVRGERGLDGRAGAGRIETSDITAPAVAYLGAAKHDATVVLTAGEPAARAGTQQAARQLVMS